MSVFAGLRPLAAPQDGDQETKEISRSHKLSISDSGLITMIGGKWTTYRQMGEDIVDKAILLGGLNNKKCVTENMAIHGYVQNIDHADHLYVFGSDIPKIKTLIAQNPKLVNQIHPDLPFLMAEVVWCAREEMARTVEDFLSRRTRALLLNARASIEMAPIVAKLMRKELNQSKKWEKEQIKIYTELANGYIL